jgi:hypothetical protein
VIGCDAREGARVRLNFSSFSRINDYGGPARVPDDHRVMSKSMFGTLVVAVLLTLASLAPSRLPGTLPDGVGGAGNDPAGPSCSGWGPGTEKVRYS